MSALDKMLLNLPDFSAIKPDNIVSDLALRLNKNRKQLAELLTNKNPTWETLMQPLEEMSDELHRFFSPITHMHAVTQTENLREAYNQALPILTAYHTEISQNEALYQAVKMIRDSEEFKTLNAAQQKIIEDDLRDFRLSGIHLNHEDKARFAALQQQMSKLTTQFTDHLLDATNAWTLHITDEARIEGLPSEARELAIESAKNRNLSGFLFTLEYPSYSTAMKFLKDRKLRRVIYEAYATRASDRGPHANQFDNTNVMEDILNTRHEIATLVGFANYADYSLATKMAKTSAQVMRFLAGLVNKSKKMAEDEYQELKAFAAAMDNISDLQVWDIAYYSEKLQESKFKFSQEDIRPYFPIDHVLQGMFQVMQNLFGLQIREEKNISVWHPDAKFFSVFDGDNHLRGGFYIDLYARPHKRDGAWMDEYCTRMRHADGKLQVPVAYLTCNFMQPTENKPALLTHDDVLTLFHEFGHCLHHLLSQVEYPSVSGINGVPWDAVEFPSQIMEYFCWEKASLDRIAKHYETNEALPDSLYKKMLAAKNFQTGMQMVRQLEFAIFDFRLHLEYSSAHPKSIQATLDEVRKQTAAIPNIPEYNRFQHSFSHIFAGGYAAGYYSYKWAEVLSADAYAKFEEDGVVNSATGRSFMQNILEVGGVRDPMVSFVAFRGREPTTDALLKYSGIVI